jgi:hypothetical protein
MANGNKEVVSRKLATADTIEVPITNKNPMTALAVPAISTNRLKQIVIQFGKMIPPQKKMIKVGTTMCHMLTAYRKLKNAIKRPTIKEIKLARKIIL